MFFGVSLKLNNTQVLTFILIYDQVVLLFSSFGVEPMCKILGAKVVWGISNFIIFACMLSTVFISFLSKGSEMNGTIRVASLLLFSILGVPLSVSSNKPCHFMQHS